MPQLINSGVRDGELFYGLAIGTRCRHLPMVRVGGISSKIPPTRPFALEWSSSAFGVSGFTILGSTLCFREIPVP
jgi:hypothetical protein